MNVFPGINTVYLDDAIECSMLFMYAKVTFPIQ